MKPKSPNDPSPEDSLSNYKEPMFKGEVIYHTFMG